MLQAELQSRRIIGYSNVAKLVIGIERRHVTIEALDNPARCEDAESAVALATV